MVFDGTTASLRLQQRLTDSWNFVAHAMQQRLKTDDGTAFPFGVYDPATYECAQWCDRYAPDGSFTYWEYASNKRTPHQRRAAAGRRRPAAAAACSTAWRPGPAFASARARRRPDLRHRRDRPHAQPGHTAVAGFTEANTNPTDPATRFCPGPMAFGGGWQLWAGLRHTQLERQAERTSATADGGLRTTNFRRNASTPWVAVAYELAPRTMLYASWGKGLETDVAPNRSRYGNAGQSLELSSRQFELGIKHGSDRVEAALTLFDIDRGQTQTSASAPRQAPARG